MSTDIPWRSRLAAVLSPEVVRHPMTAMLRGILVRRGNKGNDTAFDITVTDTLSVIVDVIFFQMVATDVQKTDTVDEAVAFRGRAGSDA